jgi:hypothetical protein
VTVDELIGDPRTRARLTSLRAGVSLTRSDVATADGCYLCGGRLPAHRAIGRCGWCAVAARLHAGCAVPDDITVLFDPALFGRLPFGAGAPAA